MLGLLLNDKCQIFNLITFCFSLFRPFDTVFTQLKHVRWSPDVMAIKVLAYVFGPELKKWTGLEKLSTIDHSPVCFDRKDFGFLVDLYGGRI